MFLLERDNLILATILFTAVCDWSGCSNCLCASNCYWRAWIPCCNCCTLPASWSNAGIVRTLKPL